VGGDIAGGVERLTPRATYLRSVDGRLHVVSNGAICSYPISPATGRATVDLGVAYEEDLDRVLAVLGQKAKAFVQEPGIAGQLIEASTVIGPLTSATGR
jgi:small-conductance mechanosensitive channel